MGVNFVKKYQNYRAVVAELVIVSISWRFTHTQGWGFKPSHSENIFLFSECRDKNELIRAIYFANYVDSIFGGRRHGRPKSLEWTDKNLSSREIPILYWNGLIVGPELAASHTLEWSFPWSPPMEDCPTPKWTDGCPSSRELLIL